MLDVFIIILFSIILTSGNKMNSEYLGITNTNYVRGILALFVVFHHISQRITTSDNFQNFVFMGEYAVSTFFFLSAYSLLTQHLNREDYLKNFWKKRLFKLFIPYFFFSVVYFIFWFSQGLYRNINSILTIFTERSPIISNGWFLQAIIAMYVLFYFSFKFIKSIKLSIIVNIVVIVAAIKYMIDSGNWGMHEYDSLLAFPLGLIWAYYKEKIDLLANKFYTTLLIIFSIFLFIGHHHIRILATFSMLDYDIQTALATNFANIAFVIFFIWLTIKTNLQNKLFAFLGKISLELYLIHGLFVYYLNILLGKEYKNDLLYLTLVVSCSIVSAYLINKLLNKITKKM